MDELHRWKLLSEPEWKKPSRLSQVGAPITLTTQTPLHDVVSLTGISLLTGTAPYNDLET